MRLTVGRVGTELELLVEYRLRHQTLSLTNVEMIVRGHRLYLNIEHLRTKNQRHSKVLSFHLLLEYACMIASALKYAALPEGLKFRFNFELNL